MYGWILQGKSESFKRVKRNDILIYEVVFKKWILLTGHMRSLLIGSEGRVLLKNPECTDAVVLKWCFDQSTLEKTVFRMVFVTE